jgi:hypothetical protein
MRRMGWDVRRDQEQLASARLRGQGAGHRGAAATLRAYHQTEMQLARKHLLIASTGGKSCHL